MGTPAAFLAVVRADASSSPGASSDRFARGSSSAAPSLVVPSLAAFAGDGPDDFLSDDPDPGSDARVEPGSPVELPTLRDALANAIPPLAPADAPATLDPAHAALDARSVVGAGALDDVDALGPRGARVLLAWLASAAARAVDAPEGGDETLRGGAHGGLGRLLCRALASPDDALVAEALEIIGALELRALQLAVAELFVVRAGELAFATVEEALLTLERIGDGRCVRTMEAALAAHQDALTSHQAWRARRIVQRIRRFWRK